MFISKKFLGFICCLSVAQASEFIKEIDVYGGPVPKAFKTKGITYTTPALQGVSKNHISMQEIENILDSQLKNNFINFIHYNNICIILRKNSDKDIEVASVWKE